MDQTWALKQSCLPVPPVKMKRRPCAADEDEESRPGWAKMKRREAERSRNGRGSPGLQDDIAGDIRGRLGNFRGQKREY